MIEKDKTYEKYLENNKFYFVPVLNVDGVALIEKGWEKDHKILPIRKNRDSQGGQNLGQAPTEALGVDLNRNFGINFAESFGHPEFAEDNWIAKTDKKKDDEEAMVQL